MRGMRTFPSNFSLGRFYIKTERSIESAVYTKIDPLMNTRVRRCAPPIRKIRSFSLQLDGTSNCRQCHVAPTN